MRTLLTLAAVLITFLFSFQGAAVATNCKDIDSVDLSAHPSFNNNFGGHLNTHIWKGALPPQSQLNKTLFYDVMAWEDAYEMFKERVEPCDCPLPPSLNDFRRDSRPFQYPALYCDAADSITGVCKHAKDIQGNSVTYVLRVIAPPPDHVAQWIIEDAYPTETTTEFDCNNPV